MSIDNTVTIDGKTFHRSERKEGFFFCYRPVYFSQRPTVYLKKLKIGNTIGVAFVLLSVLGAGLMYSYELKNQQTPAAVYLKKD